MKTYYINGNKVAETYAQHRFCQYHMNSFGTEKAECLDMWEQCQFSEEARDDWLPANLEIVQE